MSLRDDNMKAADTETLPSNGPQPAGRPGAEDNGAANGPDRRYRRLPTGAHGLDREEVASDQRDRLKRAMIELIGVRGYQAVRILDLTQLAHVSRPTFYELYRDKEALLLAAYDDIAERMIQAAQPGDAPSSPLDRVPLAIEAFARLAAAEPEAMSLFLFGAFGAGPKALAAHNRALQSFERTPDGAGAQPPGDLTVKAILGGIREVTATRLRQHRESELAGLAAELAAWAASYPRELPVRLGSPRPWEERESGDRETLNLASERARRAEGRLPSGRHDLSREFVAKAQRERIVDATAAIVAERGLAGLTIPEIARRAKVSHATFYAMYTTKRDAFLGAQKVGMHQAFLIAVEEYEAHRHAGWSHAVAEGLRALLLYLRSEPAHAHLSIVDTFAASPETLEVRDETLRAFSVYLSSGERPAVEGVEIPAIAPEAVVGGIWQILHYYIENGRLAELVEDLPQLIFLTLVPFLGAEEAATVACAYAGAGSAR